VISLDPPRSAPRAIRTFHPRRGRISGERVDALARLSPRFGLTIAGAGNPGSLDLAELFGREAPVVLEIGSGMGDATAAMAAADPDRDYLAVDVHTPGLAHLLTLVEARGLTNVRVARGDALELLTSLAPGALAAIHVFFPDPWPKARHHKRRLIQPKHLGLFASRLAQDGMLHCATDAADYAEGMLEALTADSAFLNTFDGYAPRPAHRPETKFERRGLDAGRGVFDLVFRRR
jgi:tRNA (guanine-N7-)-methyltransferase